mmetsp:Transcript_77080/g.121735  ORF Transcript_77080/g.121735 Transcript_77080/m.121735 type:complete len:140 (-) Transcript_77080:115-534(-)|eukprot:CAMPEP_0169140826 /NCGR_PEP_ID=MMETSP1015-20121227/43867_1 /TAXON_ID=342587 /ORGANISM="Karlodinium micrum, Strain CCMP2283" /LENGTH=139 /DNA_ID=CAMNT_0009206939 /DNA_START=65 /DNA_END=484 /DNA_ORIENTATION=+
MASNSLRGGKNIYSHGTLMSNWAEERLEPKHKETCDMKSKALPTKSSKTWTTTSAIIGDEQKHLVEHKFMGTDTGDWFKYQKEHPDHYVTTHNQSYAHPNERQLAHDAPHVPEDRLSDYREKWTRTDPATFERLEGPGR